MTCKLADNAHKLLHASNKAGDGKAAAPASATKSDSLMAASVARHT